MPDLTFKNKIGKQLLSGMLILSLLPLCIIGLIAYSSGKQSIIDNVQSHLESVAKLKQQAIHDWTEHLIHKVHLISTDPRIIHSLEKFFIDPDRSIPNSQKAVSNITMAFGKVISLGHIAYISIIDPETGRVLLSSNPNWIGTFLEHDQFFIEGKKEIYVSEIFQTLSLGKPTMVISSPIINDSGSLIGVLAAYANLDQLSGIMLERSGLSDTTETFLVNKSNLLITNTVFAPDGAFKKWMFGDGAQWATSGKSGVDIFMDYRDVEVIGAYLWMPERKLALIAKQDSSEAFAPATLLGLKISVIGILISAAVLLIGFSFARRITRPIQKIVTGARIIGKGNLDYRLGVYADNEIGLLSSEFNRMTENLKQITTSNKEKEVLLREIHHRVKNNLQMIQSMLNLQINQTQNQSLQNHLQDGINRIYSISLVHETLYQSKDLSMVDLNGYFSSLIRYLFKSIKPPETQVSLDCSIEQIDLDIDTIITCGLIINELVTNALKYAFPNKPGKITVELKHHKQNLARLIVADNGCGLKHMCNEGNRSSLGLTLVRTLVKNQLEGEMIMDNSSGLIYDMRFPIN